MIPVGAAPRLLALGMEKFPYLKPTLLCGSLVNEATWFQIIFLLMKSRDMLL